MLDLTDDVTLDLEIRKIIDLKNIPYNAALKELIAREQRSDFMRSTTADPDSTQRRLETENELFDFAKKQYPHDQNKASELAVNLITAFQKSNGTAFNQFFEFVKKNPDLNFNDIQTEKDEILYFSKTGKKVFGNNSTAPRWTPSR